MANAAVPDGTPDQVSDGERPSPSQEYRAGIAVAGAQGPEAKNPAGVALVGTVDEVEVVGVVVPAGNGILRPSLLQEGSTSRTIAPKMVRIDVRRIGVTECQAISRISV